jgi:hypothetical protein
MPPLAAIPAAILHARFLAIGLRRRIASNGHLGIAAQLGG